MRSPFGADIMPNGPLSTRTEEIVAADAASALVRVTAWEMPEIPHDIQRSMRNVCGTREGTFRGRSAVPCSLLAVRRGSDSGPEAKTPIERTQALEAHGTGHVENRRFRFRQKGHRP